MPIRQAYINGIIPSQQRATVLSFDSLMGNAGGVIAQPALGRVADVSGYATAYVVSAAIQLTAVPFLAMARRERAASDVIEAGETAGNVQSEARGGQPLRGTGDKRND
jgi:MFS family permease